MLYQVFSAQWKYPTNKQDWTEMVRRDLLDFGMEVDLDWIRSKSKLTFKNMVKIKSKEYSFFKFMVEKEKHSKMANLWYSDLQMENYLKSNKFTVKQSQTIFSFRTRMANFQENFRNDKGHLPCPLCLIHLDSQSMAFQCPKVKVEVKVEGK